MDNIRKCKQLWNVLKKFSVMSVQNQDFTLAPKLKQEHLQLTSYSHMYMDVAVQ